MVRRGTNLRYLWNVSGEPSNIGSRYLRQRILLVSFLMLGLLFVATVALARAYEARKETLVREWAQAGDSGLAAGKPDIALADYRNALAYDPDNGPVQLHLAQALLAAGRLQEAHTYFLNLWERTPGSGNLNLELARTSAQMGDPNQAILYYRTAILGSWDQNPEGQRRSARLDLCQYLIANGRTSEAQAEIGELAADTPPSDGRAHSQAGELFTRVGEPTRALAEFEQALKTRPNDSALNERAGQAALDAADYVKAERYLTRALREAPSDQVRKMLVMVREIEENDPFLAGLSDREKARRTLSAYQQASGRFEDCRKRAGGGQGEEATRIATLSREASDLKRKVSLSLFLKDPEMQDQAMQLVFQMEELTASECQAPTGLDEALVQIGKKNLQSEQ
jgi:predicted Zn-dependent protease